MPSKKFPPGEYEFSVRRCTAGLGLFTNEDIAKGACVIEYKGPRIPEKDVEKSRSRYLFEISPRRTIDGSPRWNTARYINHSCRPNCEIEIDTRRGRVFILAKRAIKAGEELSYNYGKDYFDAFINGGCRCVKCKPDFAPPGVKSTIRLNRQASEGRTRTRRV